MYHIFDLTCIDYGSNKLIQSIRNITGGFTCFKGTIFENGMDAAFASHKTNEVYFFKDDYYVRGAFTPGASNDVIMDGVRKTLDYLSSLHGIIPLKN
ncbi:unnamed protein product [Lathyrus oleraceus]